MMFHRAGMAKMLMLCLSGLIVGACFASLKRVLALAVSMAAFGFAMTLLVALLQGWTFGEGALGFAAVVATFQCGYVIVAGLRFALARRKTSRPPPSSVPETGRPDGRRA
jgi:hypothetical protein